MQTTAFFFFGNECIPGVFIWISCEFFLFLPFTWTDLNEITLHNTNPCSGSLKKMLILTLTSLKSYVKTWWEIVNPDSGLPGVVIQLYFRNLTLCRNQCECFVHLSYLCQRTISYYSIVFMKFGRSFTFIRILLNANFNKKVLFEPGVVLLTFWNYLIEITLCPTWF